MSLRTEALATAAEVESNPKKTDKDTQSEEDTILCAKLCLLHLKNLGQEKIVGQTP